MKEYENFYEREDIAFIGLDPLRNYNLQTIITRAREYFPDNIQKQTEIVKDECSKYWPVEVRHPEVSIEIIRRAGLINQTKERMKDKYKEYKIALDNRIHIAVKAFYYQEKKWFYWWDMYKNDMIIKSGLEFFPWCDHPVSYLIFATEPTQSPLMFTEQFKQVRQF